MALEQFTIPKLGTGSLQVKPRRRLNPLLLAGAILIFAGTASNLVSQPSSSPQLSTASATTFEIHTKPQRILIPSLNIDAQITEGGFKDGAWILSENSVLFVPTSGGLGEGYNTILYAHRRPGLFQGLGKIKKDDEIFVEDTRGSSFTYRVYSIEMVKATEILKLKSDIKNTLTLFTCDGPFDQFRLIVKASLVINFSSSNHQDVSGTSPPKNLLNHPVSSPAANPKPL